MRTPRQARRLSALVAALLVAALLAVGTVPPPAGAQEPAGPEVTEGVIELTGRGWGHGRGLGQYGALGYAVEHGWDTGRILDHYYGDTTLGTVEPTQAIRVALLRHDKKALVVHLANGTITTEPGGPAPGRAIKVELVQPGQFRLSDGTGCSGSFTPRAQLVTSPQIVVTASVQPPQTHDDMLQVCETGADGSFVQTRWYRGTLTAVDTGDGSRAVNTLPLDDYLRGVVPREMPASWADLGSGTGMQALRAQAVSARSYAVAEGRWSYADTCDTTSCQVYGGHAVQAIFASFTKLEDPRSDAAISTTAGQVRMRDGKVQRTEFSSSTGGWTAGGTFPAVVDDGDAISSNPNHTWTAEVKFSKLEDGVGAGKGSFRSVEVTERNGLGPDGGRVKSVVVRFSEGDVTLTGLQFRSAAGIKSDWFTVTGVRQPSVAPRDTDDSCPEGQVPPAGFTDVEGNAHERAIDCAVWWEVATGRSAEVYAPRGAVSRAQMASFIARVVEESGGTLPAATQDHFTDDDGDVHEGNINRLAEAGLVSGVGEGRYAPLEAVSRAQMATFLVTSHEYRTGTALTASRDWFSDDDASPHEPSIDKAAEAGFTGGTSPGVYGPALAVRRDQMASFLTRVLDLLVEGGTTPAPPSP